MRLGCFLAAFLFAFLVSAALLWGPLVDAVAADTIKLRTGRVLTVERVEVLDGRFRVTIPMQKTPDAERATVEFAFDRFTPKAVLKLFDRYTDREDAKSVLRGANVALEVGLPDEAQRRFRKARTLDSALADEAKQGLDKIPFARATQELNKLEARLRSGKNPTAVHEALEALLVGPHAVHLTLAQVRRIEVLSKLAKRLAKRAAARNAAKDKKKKPKKAPPKPKAPDTPPPPRDPEASPFPPGRSPSTRWRERRSPRPRPAGDLPGRQRPPLQGERGGANGGGSSGGSRNGGQGAQGGSRSGGSSGGSRSGGQGSSPPSSGSGGGQGSGLGR